MRIESIGSIVAALAVFGLCGSGCGDTEDAPEEAEAGIEEEACEHTQEGPFVDVTASVEPADAPDVSTAHTAFRIALSGGVTHVSYRAASDAEHVFFLSADVPFEVVDGEIEETASGEECPEHVAVHHTADLSVGTHILAIGPTDVSEVLLVAEASADEHHDE